MGFLHGDISEEAFCRKIVESTAGFNRDKWGRVWGDFHFLRRFGEASSFAGSE